MTKYTNYDVQDEHNNYLAKLHQKVKPKYFQSRKILKNLKNKKNIVPLEKMKENVLFSSGVNTNLPDFRRSLMWIIRQTKLLMIKGEVDRQILNSLGDPGVIINVFKIFQHWTSQHTCRYGMA